MSSFKESLKFLPILALENRLLGKSVSPSPGSQMLWSNGMLLSIWKDVKKLWTLSKTVSKPFTQQTGLPIQPLVPDPRPVTVSETTQDRKAGGCLFLELQFTKVTGLALACLWPI